MSLPYAKIVQIKQALIDVFTDAQCASGQLSTIQSVGGTNFNEAGAWPYLGVDIIQIKEPVFASNHRLRHVIEFGINVSVRSTDRLIDARSALDPILDDGAGNGVLNILRQQYYLLLGGLLEKVDFGRMYFLNNVQADDKSAPTAFFSDAVVIFYCTFSVAM